MASALRLLRNQWQRSCERLLPRLEGLSDDEKRWEPAAGCWNVRPSPDAPGGWTVDYPEVHPDPPPFTTIATLARLDQDQLDEERPTQFGVGWPARRVLAVLVDEQLRHGAEIGVLRDLDRSGFHQPVRLGNGA